MEYIKIAFTVLLAVSGWIIAHYYTSKRDLSNSRRVTRIEALSSCYKALVRSGIDVEMVVKGEDGKAINKATPVEDAIALIHLYGNQEQSNLASEYARMVGETNRGNSTELVNALRKDIRGMLGEPELVGEPAYLRVHLK